MERYAEMAKTLLQSENPEELKRIKQNGELNETMQEIQESFSQQEDDLIRQMHRDIEKENLSYQEEVGRKNMAAMCAREIIAEDMSEFIRSLR